MKFLKPNIKWDKLNKQWICYDFTFTNDDEFQGEGESPKKAYDDHEFKIRCEMEEIDYYMSLEDDQ